jgi:hypothetical protein
LRHDRFSHVNEQAKAGAPFNDVELLVLSPSSEYLKFRHIPIIYFPTPLCPLFRVDYILSPICSQTALWMSHFHAGGCVWARANIHASHNSNSFGKSYYRREFDMNLYICMSQSVSCLGPFKGCGGLHWAAGFFSTLIHFEIDCGQKIRGYNDFELE